MDQHEIEWAARLRDIYGIASPFAEGPDDDDTDTIIDEEHLCSPS